MPSLMLLLAWGCGGSTAPEEAPQKAPVPAPVPEPYWVERSDQALDDLFQQTCRRAVEEGKPVLIAFSAPWCGDCKRVRALEEQEPLRSTLAGWAKVTVDVGRFDRHAALLEAYQVSAIPHWAAVKPSCDVGVERWERLAHGVFEPESKPEERVDGAALSAWLVAARPSSANAVSSP